MHPWAMCCRIWERIRLSLMESHNSFPINFCLIDCSKAEAKAGDSFVELWEHLSGYVLDRAGSMLSFQSNHFVLVSYQNDYYIAPKTTTSNAIFLKTYLR